VSGSGNGTFSAAALTGVTSVTAPASTALTLAGGSTGASLVLGAGAGKAVFNRAVVTSSDVQFDSAAGYLFTDSGGSLTGLLLSRTNNVIDLFTANTQRGRITSTGNLLIGTTTDATSLAGGLVVNGSGAGATSSSTSTGALRVTGGVGVGGAMNVGGAATFAGAVTGNTTFTSGTLSTTAGGFKMFDAGGYFVNYRPTAARTNAFEGDASGNDYLTSFTNAGAGKHNLAASGTLAITGAATFAGAVTIAGTVIHTLSATPASATAAGTVGTMSWDANYIYICTATNTWKRVAIATW
jgi:hypothetical protein